MEGSTITIKVAGYVDVRDASKSAVIFKCDMCIGHEIIGFPDPTELTPKDANDLIAFLKKHSHHHSRRHSKTFEHKARVKGTDSNTFTPLGA